MNYLKKGLTDLLNAVRKNKLLFLSLIILQILFLSSTIYLSINYEAKILENAKGVIEPLQNANFDAESIQAGMPFTENLGEIYQNYNSMTKNVTEFSAWLIGLFLLMNLGLWVLSQQLLNKTDLEGFLKRWLKIIVSAVVVITPVLLIYYYFLISLLKVDASITAIAPKLRVLGFISMMVYYLVIVSFAAANKSKWKDFFKKIYLSGIKNAHRLLLVMLINLTLITGCLYLIYLAITIEESLLLLISSGVFLTVIIVLTRLFWISCLQNLERKNKN